MSDNEQKKTFFTIGEGHNKKLRGGRIATTAIGTILTAITTFSGLYINESTEKSLEITFGKVTQQVDTPGIKVKWPLGIDKRFAISTAKQDITCSFDKLRTGDDIKMRSDFLVEFQVREEGDITNYYNDLKGRDGDTGLYEWSRSSRVQGR